MLFKEIWLPFFFNDVINCNDLIKGDEEVNINECHCGVDSGMVSDQIVYDEVPLVRVKLSWRSDALSDSLAGILINLDAVFNCLLASVLVFIDSASTFFFKVDVF